MNQKQKLTLWIGIAVVALIGLFPPWNSVQTIATAGGAIRSTRSAGYAFLLTPPIVLEPHVKHNFPLDVLDVELDTTRLVVELMFSLVVIVGLVLVLKDGSPNVAATSKDEANLAQDVQAG
jgi:hypothetical protein